MNVLWYILFTSLFKTISVESNQSGCSFLQRYRQTTPSRQTYQIRKPKSRRKLWEKPGIFPVIRTRIAFKCCPGYAGAYPNCSPICSRNCLHGTCTAPEKCSCFSGYSSLTPYECQPVCLQKCDKNSECTAPEVCSCFKGFRHEEQKNCVPICDNGCPSGKCISSNKCQCDPGYTMNSSKTACEPVCSGGCDKNGNCTAPDVCACFKGYRIVGGNRCVPICENECPSGKCISPNKCQCDPGYTMNSSETACEPVCFGGCGENGNCTAPDDCACFEGYRIETGNRCVPICDNGCPLGKCISPNKCQCVPGYTMNSSETVCEPVCSDGCGENSNCTAPDVCTCFEGFQIEAGNLCVPICENGCPSGKCISPNKCQCDPGYTMNSSETACEPVCFGGCGENGNCTAPDVCACFEGYRIGTGNRCVPICDNRCPLGKCISPNKCQCVPGYTMNSSETVCEPVCSDGCVENSNCTAPDVCTCFEGFQIEAGNLCVPICDNGCPSGKCISPNKCQCDPGYTMNSSEKACEAVCFGGCGENGNCTAPDVCACFEGYRIGEGNHCVPICDNGCPLGKCISPNKCQCAPGYNMNSSENVCEPVCSDGCGENSNCTAPDVCTCFEGFQIEAGNHCVPICDNGCPSGKCISSNKCQCDPGYTMNSSETVCEPVCSGGCGENGNCTAPDVCTCFEGFRIGAGNLCVPICDNGCSFGKCISPNKCQCDPGYTMNSSETVCEPVCPGGCGKNGNCTAPDVCACFEGYRIVGGNRCVPICDNGCPFGKCISPNKCQCDPGYTMNFSEVDCEPLCFGERRCYNSDCIKPNVCSCWPNYIPINETSCKPNCPENCVNGSCNEPFNCTCNEGYEPHLYQPNVCIPKCDDCDYGDCVAPRQCRCWPGYETRLNSSGCSKSFDTNSFESSSSHAGPKTLTSPYSFQYTRSEIGFNKTKQASVTDIKSENSSVKETKQEFIQSTYKPSPEEQLHCNCWLLCSDIGDASNSGNCVPDCNNMLHVNCIQFEACQAEANGMKLVCSSAIFICRTLSENSSQVVRTPHWLLWAIGTGGLLAIRKVLL